jgi:hypothetical protein
VSLDRLSDSEIAKLSKPSPQSKQANTRILRSKSNAPKAFLSFDTAKLDSSSEEFDLETESEASATLSDASTSSSFHSPSPSPKKKALRRKATPRKQAKTPSGSSSSDDDSDASISSRDSIAKPKKGKKKVVKRKVGKGGLARKGKGGKALKIPPRTATWHSASDVPVNIQEHIRFVYSSFQFSKLMDHQVRRLLGNFSHSLYTKLIANSPGRCAVDAINLIKLVYNEQRGKKRHISPKRASGRAGSGRGSGGV